MFCEGRRNARRPGRGPPDGIDHGAGVEDDEWEPGTGFLLRARHGDGADDVLAAVPDRRPTPGEKIAVDPVERLSGDGLIVAIAPRREGAR